MFDVCFGLFESMWTLSGRSGMFNVCIGIMFG